MSLETGREDVDPNYEGLRFARTTDALIHVGNTKYDLDCALRGTKDATVCTLLSTAYDIIKQAEDLVKLARILDPDPRRKDNMEDD